MLMISVLGSCSDAEQVNWKPTFDANGKEPFGTYLAYNAFKYYYPKASVQKVNSNFPLTSLSTNVVGENDVQALIMVGLNFEFKDEDLSNLMSYLDAGNVAVISAQRLSSNFYKQFFAGLSSDYDTKGNVDLSIIQSEGVVSNYNYSAPEPSAKVILDSLGEGANYGFFANEPNLVCLYVGDGLLILHGAPYAFTNYYLLNDNKKYYETLLGFLPTESISKIVFSSHLAYNASDSSLSVLMRYPPLKWAIYLTVILALVYIFFEIKRRQRIVPIIPAPENNTAKFIQTMGKLYYNHANHTNLAQKKIVYFLEYVRINYYISTQVLDDDFAQRLHIKSGQSLEHSRALVTNIKLIQSGFEADDAFLIQLDQQIKLFTNGR